MGTAEGARPSPSAVSDDSRPCAGANDHERLAIEEADLLGFERGMADLIAVVDAHDSRIRTAKTKANERLRRRHRGTCPILNSDRDEGEVLAIGANAHPVGRQ